jgi:excisionase family DNA binding protein
MRAPGVGLRALGRATDLNDKPAAMADRLATHIAEEVARLLPLALDEDALAALADRLRPLIATHTVAAPAAEPLMTTGEAAARARVNVETIRRAVRSGALPAAAMIGRSPRISEVALEQWLADTAPTGAVASDVRVRRSPRRTGVVEGSLEATWSEL